MGILGEYQSYQQIEERVKEKRDNILKDNDAVASHVDTKITYIDEKKSIQSLQKDSAKFKYKFHLLGIGVKVYRSYLGSFIKLFLWLCFFCALPMSYVYSCYKDDKSFTGWDWYSKTIANMGNDSLQC